FLRGSIPHGHVPPPPPSPPSIDCCIQNTPDTERCGDGTGTPLRSGAVTEATCKDPGLGWRGGMQDDSGMTTSVRGVIARAKGEPVEVTTVLVPDPGPGEARVRVQACGVCHTDLHYR